MSQPVPKGCLAPMINRQGYYATALAGLSGTEYEEAYNGDCNKQLAILFCVCQGIILALVFLFVLPRMIQGLIVHRGIDRPERVLGLHRVHTSKVENGAGDAWTSRYPTKPGWFQSVRTVSRRMANAFMLPTVPYINLTLGQLAVLAIYSGLVIFVAVFKVGSWSTNPTRFGYVAASQIPAIFILAMKNQPLALLGYGMERIHFIHRFAGRLMLLFAVIHGSYFYNLEKKNTGSIAIKTSHLITGTIVLVMLSVIFVSGLAPIRGAFYQIFLCLHIIGYITILVALWYHDKATHPFLIVAFIAVGVDTVLKVLRTRLVNATVTKYPGGLTKIEAVDLRGGWRAGQYVWIRVVHGFKVLEKHPFTIAAAPAKDASHKGASRLTLVTKVAGDFTSRVHRIPGKDAPDPEKQNFDQQSVKVSVEGPYGGTGYTHFQEYPSVMLVGGGSGMTFCIAMLDELIGSAALRRARTNHVVVCWTVRNLDMLHAFADQIANSLTAASKTDISVCFHLHVTSKEMRRSSTDSFDVPEGVKVVASRPQIQLTLEALVERAAEEGVEGGVVVGVCGPSGLVRQTRQAVMAVDARHVGGVVLHSESFAW